MPATFTCTHIRPNNGIRQIHLSTDQGQPNHVYLNITSDVLGSIFNADVREGDAWSLQATLINRAGANGMNRG